MARQIVPGPGFVSQWIMRSIKTEEDAMRIQGKTGLVVLTLWTVFLLAACGGGGDSAPPPPDLSPAITGVTAKNITQNSAVLEATVNPKGLSTSIQFVYSPNSSLTPGTPISAGNIGSGSLDCTVTVQIPALSAGTTYYYRAIATNSGGTKTEPPSTSSPFSFNTLSTPLQPFAKTEDVGTRTTTSAELRATVNPNGEQTSAWFEYRKKTDSVLTVVDNVDRGKGTDNVPITYVVNDLAFGTDYTYRIVAQNKNGTVPGSYKDFATLGGVPTVTTYSINDNEVTTTTAVVRGKVNPNSLPTYAWWEYKKCTDNTCVNPAFTSIDNTYRGNGVSDNTLSYTFVNLTPDNTLYAYRLVASNTAAGGAPQYGDTFTFRTKFNPGPTAVAHFNETVWLAGGNGPKPYLGTTVVTMDASDSTDPRGPAAIISYKWDKISSGTRTPTLSEPGPSLAAITTTFDTTAWLDPVDPAVRIPNLGYGASDNLVYRLTVTDNVGLTGTDTIWKFVKWGFFEDFNTDDTATYLTFQTLGTNATFTHDSGSKRAFVQTGTNEGIIFSKDLKIMPADIKLYTSTGVFSLDFYPTSQFGSGGYIKIRLADASDTYYEFSTNPASLTKVRLGVVVDSAPFPAAYSQSPTDPYPIKITFSPTLTKVEAFGGTATISTEESANAFVYFEIETNQQNAYYDNIKLEAAP